MEKQGEKPALPSVYVRVKDFQSAADVEFEVCGFTCVQGKTNIGKSAVIRAIAGALQNSPVVGDVRKGAKFCSVTLRSDTWGFRWEKSEKGGGTYYLDGPEDKILDKIGQGQVDDVAKMGFESVQIGDEYTQPWFASQFKPVFLLDKSGPAVTDFISGVSRLSVLQDAIILSLRGKKKALDEVKLREDALEKLRAKESVVVGLDNLAKLGKELEEQAQSIEEYEKKVALAENLAQKIATARSVITDLSHINSVQIPKPPEATRFQRIRAMHGHWIRCEAAAKSVVSLREITKICVPQPPKSEILAFQKVAKHAVIAKLRRGVEALSNVDGIKVPTTDAESVVKQVRSREEHLRKIQKAARSVQALSAKVSTLEAPQSPEKLIRAERLWFQISGLRSEIKKLEKDHQENEVQLEEIRQELAKIPSCTSCGRPVLKPHSHAKVKQA